MLEIGKQEDFGSGQGGLDCVWWDNFMDDVVPEEWKENFRMCKENFIGLFRTLTIHLKASNNHVCII